MLSTFGFCFGGLPGEKSKVRQPYFQLLDCGSVLLANIHQFLRSGEPDHASLFDLEPHEPGNIVTAGPYLVVVRRGVAGTLRQVETDILLF